MACFNGLEMIDVVELIYLKQYTQNWSDSKDDNYFELGLEDED